MTRAWDELDRAWTWCAWTWVWWIGWMIVSAVVWNPLIVVGFAGLAVGLFQMVRYCHRARRTAKQCR